MGAQPVYGGTRVFDSEDMGTCIFSVGEGDTNVRTYQNQYAKKFIDIDNTAYYVDPGPGANGIAANFQGRIQVGTFNQSQANTGEAWIGRAADRAAGILTVQLGTGTGRKFEVVDYNWTTVEFQCGDDGHAIAAGSFKAPVFYDSNNTTYWADLASTTDSINIAGSLKMNAAGAKIKLCDAGSNSGGGIYWSSAGTSYSYAIFRDTGSWTHPYPDLRIKFHTGIAYNARSDYDGHRFYTGNTGDGDTLAMTIGEGSSNTYVVAHADIRSPVFYDYNDTNYYGHFDSKSSMRELWLDKNWYDSSSTSWGGGINLLGNAPTIAFKESGSTHQFMIHQSGGHLRFYDRSTTGAWRQDGYINYTNGQLVWTVPIQATTFYDQQNTAYYADLASTATSINIAGTINISGCEFNEQANGILACRSTSTASGMVFRNTSNTWHATLYAEGTNYGFLNGEWASWDMRKQTNAALFLNNQGTYYINPSSVSTYNDLRSVILYDFNNTTFMADLSNTGDSIRAAGNIIAYYSDERLKTKLGPIENALDKIDTLSGFYYEPNDIAQALGYEKKRHVGVSAQEVEAVLPEVVSDAPVDSRYLTVDYAKIVPLLIEGIKELKAEIEKLKKGGQ